MRTLIPFILSLLPLTNAQSSSSPSAVTTLGPTVTDASTVASILASTPPSPNLGNPFNISTYPLCSQTCAFQISNALSAQGRPLNDIRYQCGVEFNSLNAVCEKVTCSTADYERTRFIASQGCDTVYAGTPALGSSVSAAVAAATAFAVAAVQGKDPTRSADYPDCAETCQLQNLPTSGCNSIANTTCSCRNEVFLNAIDSCERANCSAADYNATGALGFELCASVGGFGDVPTQGNVSNSTGPGAVGATPSPVAFEGGSVRVVGKGDMSVAVGAVVGLLMIGGLVLV